MKCFKFLKTPFGHKCRMMTINIWVKSTTDLKFRDQKIYLQIDKIRKIFRDISKFR